MRMAAFASNTSSAHALRTCRSLPWTCLKRWHSVRSRHPQKLPLRLHSHDDLPEGVRFRCGAGALVPPPFEPKRAAVRVHAVSAPPPRRQLGPDDEGGRPGDPVHVEYQIVIENVGAVPVEVLGRCASLLCVGSIRVSLH